MTYSVSVSSKNQATLPVKLLDELGLVPNQTNHLIIYKDLFGKWIVTTPNDQLNKVAGSLKISKHIQTQLKDKKIEEIIEMENQVLSELYKKKYKK